MERPLVVGVDGSDAALRAVDWAVEEAARHGLPLRLVYASVWERYEGMHPTFGPGRPAEDALAEHIIASAAERARRRDPDVKLSTEVLAEDTVLALLREAREAFALVTGSRGRGELAALLLGSVSLAVAARAECPVVVVRGAGRNRSGGFQRVVLGVGGTGDDSAAVDFAFREAELRGTPLDAVHAWRCPARELPDFPAFHGETEDPHLLRALEALDEALSAPAAGHPSVQVSRETVEGPARKVLLHAAQSADLLVVGARRRHGAGGALGLQLGLVNHAVLHHAECPVVIVPQQD